MNKKIEGKLRILTLAVVVGALAGLSGCASSGRVDDLEARLNTVAADASAASAAASAANDKADAVARAANSAGELAQEANRRSIDTETKIDRMFEKAMRK